MGSKFGIYVELSGTGKGFFFIFLKREAC